MREEQTNFNVACCWLYGTSVFVAAHAHAARAGPGGGGGEKFRVSRIADSTERSSSHEGGVRPAAVQTSGGTWAGARPGKKSFF
eukprot:7381729-Prymnesium_polylepis.2